MSLEDLTIDELHLKFRSIVSLIPFVLKCAGGTLPTSSDDAPPQPFIDPPASQRLLDLLATILVRDYEVVAVAAEEKTRVLVAAHFDRPEGAPSDHPEGAKVNHPRPVASDHLEAKPSSHPDAAHPVDSSETQYLIASNPRYKNGDRKNGKNRVKIHGWEPFHILAPTVDVNELDVKRSCLYAFRICALRM